MTFERIVASAVLSFLSGKRQAYAIPGKHDTGVIEIIPR